MDHLVGTSVLVGAYALDAMAAAQDRREQLQRAKNSVKRMHVPRVATLEAGQITVRAMWQPLRSTKLIRC